MPEENRGQRAEGNSTKESLHISYKNSVVYLTSTANARHGTDLWHVNAVPQPAQEHFLVF